MEMALDITADHTPQSPNEIIHLTRVGTSNSVCDTDTVDTNLVDGAVDGEEVD